MIFCMFLHNITSLLTSYRISAVHMNFGPLSAPLQSKSSIATDFDFFKESSTKLGAENYIVLLKLTSLALTVCRNLWTVSNTNNDAQSIYVCDHRCQTKLHIVSGKNGSVSTTTTTPPPPPPSFLVVNLTQSRVSLIHIKIGQIQKAYVPP